MKTCRSASLVNVRREWRRGGRFAFAAAGRVPPAAIDPGAWSWRQPTCNSGCLAAVNGKYCLKMQSDGAALIRPAAGAKGYCRNPEFGSRYDAVVAFKQQMKGQ
jgi:hypothetical protein